MAAYYRILPDNFLVYVRVDGWIATDAGIRLAGAFRADPRFRKEMRQLIDLRGLTGWERDFAEIMKERARQVDVFDDPRRPTVIVVLAPGAEARSLAVAIRLSWTNTQRVVVVTVETEAEALAVLGIEAPDFTAILEGM